MSFRPWKTVKIFSVLSLGKNPMTSTQPHRIP
uniref:Uncharacterized protein n=1 Tax=Phlebotomus papatasi TaxID=29031 RepID=A0A1B0D5T9_PHLPP